MVAVSDYMVAMRDNIYGIQVCISKKKELENNASEYRFGELK